MRRAGERGLTLVEMLVVLAIIGVMAGVAVIGLGGADRNSNVQAEAQRLAASIQRAADEAIVSDAPAALRWDGEGYSFLRWDPKRRAWQDHRAPDLAARHELPGDISLGGGKADAPVPIADGTRLELRLSEGSQSWQVRFDGLNASAAPATGG